MTDRPFFTRPRQAVIAAVVALAAVGAAARSQSRTAEPVRTAAITTPAAIWGHAIGDDYFLANYQQLVAYWRTLARESPRVHVVPIGRTTEGREQVMAIVTSPANFAALDRYRTIARRLARAENLGAEEARRLAAEGKAVVWIDGGLHANEVLGGQQLIELVSQMASQSDAETLRILNDVILLAVPANPDGMDLVSDWYMAHGDTNVPVLAPAYAGHDDNRDFYMSALTETRNLNRVLYREWYPQIVYNHHQTGPRGTVMFAPPFRDPFNYFFHPNIPAGIDTIGSVMAQRFISEHKPGVTSREGQNYSTWWNGGLRTTAYFHNMIGILTETIGSPTPTAIPFVAGRQLPDSNLWWPIPPQSVWHFRRSIDYSMTANYAILDYASRYRETLLTRIYEMGRDEIQWGSEDHWTLTPHELQRAETAAGGATPPADGSVQTALASPRLRDPRGFIIPASQPDLATATAFVNALVRAGIEVLQARAPFSVAGRTYPAHSFVVKTAQAFRPHVLDMFEPQDYPDDIPYPGGPPAPPYDNAGYTLAFQMGVQFDRVLDAFDGPFDLLTDEADVPPGTMDDTPTAAGYLFGHQANDSMTIVNRLMNAGDSVAWLSDGPLGRGTFFVGATPSTRVLLAQAAATMGISVRAASRAPAGPRVTVRRPRIGLYDQYGGSIPSGWARLILEQFEFPYEIVYPPTLAAGQLSARFDVLVFNDAGLPGPGVSAGANASAGGGPGRGTVPALPLPDVFASRQGLVGAPALSALREFVAGGGTLVAIGGAARSAARIFQLPVTDPLAGLSRSDYYVPGSVLRMAVNPGDPMAHGLSDTLDVFFDNDPVFKLSPDAAARGTRQVAWFASPSPLRSGWAWGAQHLDHAATVVVSDVGRGRVVLVGPEILFRSQSQDAFKLLFNILYLAAVQNMPVDF